MWKRVTPFLLLGLWFSTPSLSQSHRINRLVEPGVVIVQYERSASHGKVAFPPILQVQSVELAFPFLLTLRGNRAQLPSVQALQKVFRVRYEADISPYQAARMIADFQGVEYAEPRFLYRTSTSPSSTMYLEGGDFPLTPNDPLFLNDGYIRLMELPNAWEVVKGEDGNVVIAIVDNGIEWEHPDLRANVWENPGEIADNGIDDDGNGFIDDVHGWNFENNSNNPNPFPGEGHGTWVAGAAAAVTDNRIGLAGTSWNAKFMPVNASCSPPNGGFVCDVDAGVLYAAINGADIINASFVDRNFGYSLRTTERVMQVAHDLGSLVVAAAGNGNVKMGGYTPYHFPSSYKSTLSVCGTQYQSYRNSYSYGYTVDVCTSGQWIETTDVNNGYMTGDGTSFATPLVSGVAALVKTRFPHYTPVQVREQIRATADYMIYDANPPEYDGLLGKGYVNAYRAVTKTDNISVRMVEWKATGTGESSCFGPSEQINITATFESFLSDAEDLTVEFISDSPHVLFPRGTTFRIGSLGQGEKKSVEFPVIPTASVPHRSFVFFEPRVRSSNGSVVSGSDAIEIFINAAEFALHETATFKYTMTSEGNIGLADISEGMIGEVHCKKQLGHMKLNGFEWMDEAGLLVGTHSDGVAGSVFLRFDEQICSGCPGIQNHDFLSVNPMEFRNGANGEQVSRVTITETKPRTGLEIIQESLVDAQSQYEDIALFRYRLRNQSSSAISGLHLGLYFNPSEDLGGIWGDGAYEMSSYQHGAVREVFPYVRLSTRNIKEHTYVGFMVLSDAVPKHYRTYDHDETWYLEQPSDAWNGLTGGITEPKGGGGTSDYDSAQLIGSGPYHVPENSEVVVEFAMVYGESRADLVTNAERVHDLRNRWKDPPGISAPSLASVSEGDSLIFWVYLSGAPSNAVTLEVTGYQGTDITPNQTTLTFRADQWFVAQPVTLNTVEDPDIDHDEVTLSLIASGGGYGSVEHSVNVTITDNGVGAIAAPVSVELEEGNSGSFEIALRAAPRGNVTVNLTGYQNTGLKPDPISLTFNPSDWNIPQTVNLTAVTDNNFLDDEVPLVLNISGGGYSTS